MVSISIDITFTVLEVLIGFVHYHASLFHNVNYIDLKYKNKKIFASQVKQFVLNKDLGGCKLSKLEKLNPLSNDCANNNMWCAMKSGYKIKLVMCFRT